MGHCSLYCSHPFYPSPPLQFERKHPDESGRISETDFAELLVAYANLSEKKRERMIRRVMKKFGGDNTLGITMPEYQNFFR